jgi:hypothetical protein
VVEIEKVTTYASAEEGCFGDRERASSNLSFLGYHGRAFFHPMENQHF